MARSWPSTESGTRFVEVRPLPWLLRIGLALPFLHDRWIKRAVLHGYLKKRQNPDRAVARPPSPGRRRGRGGADVREPRRPVTPSGSMGARAEPPE